MRSKQADNRSVKARLLLLSMTEVEREMLLWQMVSRKYLSSEI